MRIQRAKPKQGGLKPKKRAERAPSNVRVFRRIGSLLTLEGAARKGARRVSDADLGEISKAALIESGGRIVWLGPQKALDAKLRSFTKGTRIEEYDVGGRSLLPAFVECHTHLVFAGNRADEFELRNRGASYQEIAERGGGIAATVVPTRQAGLAELTRSAQSRADAFVRQGVATIEVKSGYALETEGEIKLLRAAGKIRGPRIVRTFLGPHAVPKDASSAAQYMDVILEEMLPRVRKANLAERADIFVEARYFGVDLARRYLTRARELGFDLAVHAEQLTRSGGAGLAVEFGARSAEHLIKVDRSDIASLAASETTCVLLPAADLYLKCAYPPARALLDAGACVAIATDFNPGSSPTQSLSLVGVLARLEMKMTLPETLAAYTIGAATALGLEAECGSIEAGKAADFTIMDCDWRDLFYSIGEMPVHSVFCGGSEIWKRSI